MLHDYFGHYFLGVRGLSVGQVAETICLMVIRMSLQMTVCTSFVKMEEVKAL